MTPLRVLHAINDVAGVAGALAAAERSIGLDSHSVVLRQSPYQFPVDEVLCADGAGPLVQELARWRTFVRAARHFDVIHCNWGQGLLPRWQGSRDDGPFAHLSPVARRTASAYIRAVSLRDLRLLRTLGKVVAVTYQGSDARQGDWCRTHQDVSFVDEVPRGFYSDESDEAKRRAIRVVDRWADLIYAHNPDTMHVLPARTTFRPYATVDLDVLRPTPLPDNEVPIVVHAPTNRAVKGTRFLIEAVDRLAADGVRVDLRLVEGVPFEEAVRRYSQADLFVDQLLLGWYGGGAAQVMALGRPVVAYLREDDLRFVPDPLRADLPVVAASPAELAGVLRDLLADRGRRQDLAQRGRAYVERWHNPRRIAEGLRGDYERIRSERTGT